MSKQILLVDDSSMSRKMIRRQIPAALQEGITECENGVQALEYLRKGGIDLLLLDLTMPEMDGYQVLETMNTENIHCATIVISADIQAEAMVRVKELGAQAFLSKPMDKEQFIAILEKNGLA